MEKYRFGENEQDTRKKWPLFPLMLWDGTKCGSCGFNIALVRSMEGGFDDNHFSSLWTVCDIVAGPAQRRHKAGHF